MKLTILFLSLLGAAFAQMQDNTTPSLKCDNNGDRGNRARYCEMREQTVAYAGLLNVDGKDNGGVSVKGWSRSDVLVRMKVEASSDSESDARGIVGQVRVSAAAGRIAADGPANENNRNWSVSYEIFAQHQLTLEVTTRNGGVHLADLRGNITFSAVNGGVHLARVDGQVKGGTTNGGLHIQLAGNRWEGQGLDVKTVNGGVHMEVPANYSAQLESSTSNGGFKSDFGDTAEARRSGSFKGNIGAGGAPLRVSTVNGGVHVNRI